ncbi:hypothetical protein Tco_0057657 [Tanacetum coccineum]
MDSPRDPSSPMGEPLVDDDFGLDHVIHKATICSLYRNMSLFAFEIFLIQDLFETVIEHEEFMDHLMRKLKGADDIIKDSFKIVETKVEKYPIHDEETHRRMQKQHVGDRFVNAEQLKECLIYHALANGFSCGFTEV